MKLSRILTATLFAFTALYELPVLAQSCFKLTPVTERAKEVMQDNEIRSNGHAIGNFFSNPLRINGHPLDYDQFSIQSKGELTLIKESFLIGQTIKIPFYIYLRRNGEMIKLPGEDGSKSTYLTIEISTILKLAKPGDHLIIEPVNKEDGQAKRILKLLEDRC